MCARGSTNLIKGPLIDSLRATLFTGSLPEAFATKSRLVGGLDEGRARLYFFVAAANAEA